MTLNGVMAVILSYFSEFAYLPGVLGKSSRSLSSNIRYKNSSGDEIISSPDEFL